MRKYNPGDIVLVKGKIVSATELEDSEFTYSFKPNSGQSYNIVTVNEADIRRSIVEVKPS